MEEMMRSRRARGPHSLPSKWTVYSRQLISMAIFALAATAYGAAEAAPSPAQQCAEAKLKATGQKAKKKLECHANAVKNGVAVNLDCLAKAETEFESAFDEAEAKGGCAPSGDKDDVEATVDAYVEDVVTELPDDGTKSGRACAAAKLKATGQKAKKKLECRANAVKHGVAVDPDCLAKAETEFESAFDEAEARGGCFTTGDADEIEAKTDTFVAGCPDGDPCDDGTFCNGADTCSGGTCSSHTGDPCAGGAECNTYCNEAAGNCFNSVTTACTDEGNVCTDDYCDGAGTCAHTNNTASCDDNNACTTGDTCSGGVCAGVDTSATDCNDGNACTTDSCDPGSGCINDPITACVDSDGCCPSGCNTSSSNLDNDCPAACGNGSVDGSEECDDGAFNNDTTPDACRTNCLLPYCGDGVADPSNFEDCDGTNLNGEDCASQGFTGGGTLACDGLCKFDTSNCSNE